MTVVVTRRDGREDQFLDADFEFEGGDLVVRTGRTGIKARYGHDQYVSVAFG